MHKNAMKCNETLSKWCKNKHGASKIIDMFDTYQLPHNLGAGIEAFWLLVAKLTCRRPWQSTTLQPVSSPAPISRNKPCEEIIAIRGPRKLDHGGSRIPSPTIKEGYVSRFR
jgi:hypothetical protein